MAEKLTASELEAAARAQGLPLPKGQMEAVLTGANWLRRCVELLRKAGLGT